MYYVENSLDSVNVKPPIITPYKDKGKGVTLIFGYIYCLTPLFDIIYYTFK